MTPQPAPPAPLLASDDAGWDAPDHRRLIGESFYVYTRVRTLAAVGMLLSLIHISQPTRPY